MWSKGICWDRASDSPTKRPLLFCHPATLLYFPWEFGGQLDIKDGPAIYLQAHIIKRCRINDVTSPIYFYVNVSRWCYISVIFSCRCTFLGAIKTVHDFKSCRILVWKPPGNCWINRQYVDKGFETKGTVAAQKLISIWLHEELSKCHDHCLIICTRGDGGGGAGIEQTWQKKRNVFLCICPENRGDVLGSPGELHILVWYPIFE